MSRNLLPPMGGPTISPRRPGGPQEGPRRAQQPPLGGQEHVSPAALRRAQDARAGSFDKQLAVLNERLDGQDRRIGDLIEVVKNPAMGQLVPQGGLGALGEAVQRAVYTGRCLPYNAVVDLFIPKGTQGEAFTGDIFVTQDGPVFISRVLAYAQIDQNDPGARDFPLSLIDPPLCSETDAELNNTAQFTVSPADLLPAIDVSGMFIPVSPRNCGLICCGTESSCGTLACEGQPEVNFNVRHPIAMLDHPECFDGLVEIFTNDCGWQSVAYPMAMLEDAMFDITNESPDCIGVCGFVDCQKVLKATVTPTRQLRYDVNLSLVFAGFRVLTCGGPACSTG